MLAKITLENFFSFGEATTIELNPDINILVGINGSGKSNFLKAIYLLKEAVAGKGFEKVFLTEWGGFDAVANYNSGNSEYIRLVFEFDKDYLNKQITSLDNDLEQNIVYDISINRQGTSSYYIDEKLSTPFVKSRSGALSNDVYMDIKNSSGFILGTDLKDGGTRLIRKKNTAIKSTELILGQFSDPDRYKYLNIIQKAFELISTYSNFNTTLTSSLRQATGFTSENNLDSNGENLISILNKIKNNHALEYDKIEAYLNKINPHFKDISFNAFGSKFLLMLREKQLNKAISIEHISDGTLRYLLLLAIFYNPERGGLICIDEPETGLHPDMINTICESIKYAAKDNTQFFLATHSPFVLNAFEIEDVLIFEKDKKNQTIVKTKSEEDFKDWNEDFMVGNEWLKGSLGGKRW